jgi:hypothetical protein
LRRALGRDALRGAGVEAVGVNAVQIWCDACAFEAALDAGRPADALELWRGEFLPGLHVPGGEFDRWVDGTRDRLARRAMEAADRLRLRAEEQGDLEPWSAGPGAAPRWRRTTSPPGTVSLRRWTVRATGRARLRLTTRS